MSSAAPRAGEAPKPSRRVTAVIAALAVVAVVAALVLVVSWFSLDDVGGPVETLAEFLPFLHALDAMRAVLADGAGFGAIVGDPAWEAAFTAGAVAPAIGAMSRRLAE